MSSPVYDLAAERSVLSYAFLVPDTIRTLTGEIGLTPDHFFTPGHQAIYRAMIDVHDGGDMVDQEAIRRRIPEAANHDLLHLVTNDYFANHAYRDHAKRVITCHRYERIRHAGIILADAATRMDDQQVADAERLLTEPAGHEGTTLTGEQRRERALDRLQEKERRTFPTPWGRINDLIGGGMWPGRYMALAGHTAHGKSVATDQLLEHAADRGLNVGLYLTETTEQERTERSIARNGTLTYSQVQERKDFKAISDTILKLPDVTCIEAHDWTVLDIVRHVGRHRWDLCAIDIFHDLPLPSGGDNEVVKMREMGRLLSQAAKRYGVAMVNVMHLNEKRVVDQPPMPVNSDIYGPSALYKQADVVMMVWQQEDDDGPTGEGNIRVTKCRQGRTGAMSARFVGERQRWAGVADEPGLRAVA